MKILFYLIAVPIALSIPCFISKRCSPWIALTTALAGICAAAEIFFSGYEGIITNFQISTLNAGLFLAASFYALLIILYSIKYMEGNERLGEYYGYLLITAGAAAGAFFANDYFTLLIFWGIISATLYMLIGIGGPGASSAAKKTLIIVGGSDAFMIFGIGIVWMMTKSLQIGSLTLPLYGWLPAAAFLSLLAGALAKAGAMPFHSWIPECAETAPIPVTAYLPASLDKLLGIYLLFRMCTDIFQVTPNSPASILLLAVGSFTIIAGGMAALVQINQRKLLSFCAVSQVGYMVLGMGTALPVGMAGGLLHLFNHTIYKSCLFLTSGSVEKEAGTGEFDKLGGLAASMPVTFACAAIAALSVSGVPPLNGFFSKWIIYQGVIGLSGTGKLWIIWLCAAMFGSALTLASSLKLIHAVYLGQGSGDKRKVKETSWLMWLPSSILAALCLIFGIFAYPTLLARLIIPSVKGVEFSGSWNPALASVLLFIGLLAGLLIYLISKGSAVVSRPSYIGGEKIEESAVKVSGTGFYNTIRDYGPLDGIYRLAEGKALDIYEVSSRAVSALYDIFGFLHNGLLHTYLAWMFLGSVILAVLLIL